MAIAALMACPPGSRAEFLTFRGGGTVQLPCRRVGSKVIVDAPGGPVEFQADDFLRILPGGVPAEEWPSRLASARAGGSDRLLAASWWALENGLTPEATATLRVLHASDPKHEPTATLVQTLDAIAPPLPDSETHDLSEALGGTFRTARSAHFLLLHQGSAAGAEARLDVLERVYTSYFLTIAGHGIVLDPPRHKLIAASFAAQADYIAFLRRENAGAFATTQGFYHPSRHAVISFDPRDLPSTRSRLAPSQRAHPVRDLARRSLLVDLDCLSIELGMAAHEAIHQLVAATRLAPRHDSFPTWLHEGLAAQFEVVRGGRWAGVGRANDLRLADWRAMVPSPRLAPIVRDEGFGQGYRKDLYAEAWSLVYFLRKRHPAEFTRFLDLLRAPTEGSGDPARLLDLFRTSFVAELSVVEVEWHRFLRTVRTPLEGSPIPPPGSPSQIRETRD